MSSAAEDVASSATVATGGTRPQSLAGFQFPELATVQLALASVLCDGHQQDVKVIAREPNLYATAFPSEIVTCTLHDGTLVRLLCKYGSSDQDGLRRGVPYEAEVYRRVLRNMQPRVPIFYGSYVDESTGLTALCLEYVADSVRVNHTPDPSALPLAARWIGEFHRVVQARLSTEGFPFLTRCDASYFSGWVQRTSLFAGPLHARFPWFQTLCERSTDLFQVLLEYPATVIHGDYYPHNIIYRSGAVFAVDWESAAVGAGVIDLAWLAYGWPPEIARNCERAYSEARWPAGAPTDFGRSLDAAHMYMMFRYLGDRPEWTTHPGSLWRFEHLADAGTRWGLI